MASCGRMCGFILRLLKTIEMHFFQSFTTNQSHWFVMGSHSFFSHYLSFQLFSSSVFYKCITAPFITFKCFLFPSPKLCIPDFYSCSLFIFSPFFILPPFLPSSAFVPAVLAYSAGSAPALPIMLAVEKEKEQKTGMREEWKPLVHAGKQKITFAPSERWRTRRTEREG